MPLDLYNAVVDSSFQLEDAAAAITADGQGSATIDIGANKMHGDILVNITAIDVTTGDEGYAIILEGSTTTGFDATTVTELGRLTVGGATDARPNADVVVTVGTYAIPFRSEQDGTNYRFLRLSFDVSGTTPSITCTAWGVKRE